VTKKLDGNSYPFSPKASKYPVERSNSIVYQDDMTPRAPWERAVSYIICPSLTHLSLGNLWTFFGVWDFLRKALPRGKFSLKRKVLRDILRRGRSISQNDLKKDQKLN